MNSKKSAGKYSFMVFFLAFGILTASFFPVLAQDKKDDKDNKQEKIKVSAEEEKAVNKILKSKTLAEKVTATQEFIQKFPKSPARNQAAGYLAGQITQSKNDAEIIQNGETFLTIFNEPTEADFILPGMIYSYVESKRYKDAFSTAEKYLARHPEDVSIRLKLAIDGSNLVRSGTNDFAQSSGDFAAKAIELIEANKKPSDVDDALWNEYKTKWLPQLYLSSGIISFSGGDIAKARTNFQKATQLEPGEINSWILLARMSDDEYQALANKYNASSPGAARDEMLKQANAKIDETIDLYARIVALTDGKPEAKNINDQIRESLSQYYKYRHKNLDGMNDLINKYKK